ncbi:Disease resistance protein L6 [Linum grandiflorum]
MDQQQKWCLLGALAVLFLAVIVVFLPKKSFQISHGNSSSNPESAAEKEPSSASASSSSSAPPMEYEVFLSFRGPDVRANFVDFLYRDLDRSKIRTFLDDVELRKGEEIAPSLVKAIEESKVYIPILSQNYASSKWCLRELALMMKCRNQGNGHIILPIFYMMAPRDVRHQEGSYKEAFRQHANRYKMETVNEWKDALGEVGNMKGWHVTESDRQGAIIGKVFTEVWSHLMSNYMLVTDELIGIESHVEKVTRLLSSDSEGVRIVGIHGMGGIGKTTIAKAVYNGIFGQFDRFWFLEDAREVLSKSNGVVTLQSMLISSILRTDYKVKDASEGLRVIKDRVCQHKVLVVLDNVNDSFEFDKILGKWDEFSSGSRFIVTTRDKRILQVLQECKFYEPGEMNHEHALVLFCKHAFGTDKPPEGEGFLSMEFVKAAAGLPLALKVIGSLLFRRERRFREAKLIEFKDIPPEKLQERLKVSYNDLTRTERQIFLDIASSFIGEKRDLPSYMWNDCRLYPESGISTLMLRSLVRFNERNEFLMHDHIRDLGIAVIREENNQHPWKRSRIWSNEDALEMLKDEEGSDQVEVLRVNMEEETLELTDEQFKKLTGLRYLEVFSGRLTGDFKGVLPNLRLQFLDLSDLQNMEQLSIFGCTRLTKVNGFDKLKLLKSLSLSDCTSMKELPDLSGLKNLKYLNIDGCTQLVDIKGLEELVALEMLDMSGCTSVTKLPDVSGLKHLEKLVLDDCTQLSAVASLERSVSLRSISMINCVSVTKFPDLSGLTNLDSLQISGCTGLTEVTGIESLESLEVLNMSGCCSLTELPDLCELAKITSLDVSECKQLVDVMGIENLESLRELKMTNCVSIQKLPDLSGFTNLLELDISGCVQLGDVSGIEKLDRLTSIEITDSMELESLPNLANLNNLTLLVLRETSVREIHGLEKLMKLETLEISEAPNLINLGGLEHLKLLKRLVLVRCYVLEKLPDLSNLAKLQRLEIGDCKSFRVLPSLHDLKNLKTLLIRECEQLVEVVGLENIETLQVLVMCGLSSIKNSLDLSCFKNLLELDISGSTQLTEIVGLEGLELLKKLSMRGCESIEKLPSLSGLKHVLEIDLSRCRRLTEVVGIEKLESLKILLMVDCESITKLPDLSCLKHLWRLEISGCTQLTGVTGIEAEKLKSISLWGCTDLGKVPNLSGCDDLELLNFVMCMKMSGELRIDGLKNLKVLKLVGTPITELTGGGIGALRNLQQIYIDGTSLTELPDDIGSLPSLKKLQIRNSKNLERLPNLANLNNLTKLVLHDIVICEIRGLRGMRMLETLEIRAAWNLMHLDGLELLTHLKKLCATDCCLLEKLPRLWNLTKLQELEISECRQLYTLRSSAPLRITGPLDDPELEPPEISGSMEPLLLLSNLGNLRTVYLSNIGGVPLPNSSRGQFIDLSCFRNLREVSIHFCNRLTEVKGLESLEFLESLSIEHCTSLRKSVNVSGLRSLKKLTLIKCTLLSEVAGLEELVSLQKLKMRDCTSIKELPNVSCFEHLIELDISGCTELIRVGGIESLKKLVQLRIDDRLMISPLKGDAARIKRKIVRYQTLGYLGP